MGSRQPLLAKVGAFGALAALCSLGCGPSSLGGSASTDAAAACGDAFAPPVPQPSIPTMPGCYQGVDGGWIPVLCACQLPIDNMTGAPATFFITLDMSAASPAPSFGGSLDVEVSFDDPDASWYLVWSKQPAAGTDYLVTNGSGTTTVQLGTPSLVLAPVPLSGCGARLGTATISGTYDPSWATLSLNMTASIEGRGAGAATTTANCQAPIPL